MDVYLQGASEIMELTLGRVSHTETENMSLYSTSSYITTYRRSTNLTHI